MDRYKIIEQLKLLKLAIVLGCQQHKIDGEQLEQANKDVKALNYAIRELEITAHEVPVQEQSKFIPETSEGVCSSGLSSPNKEVPVKQLSEPSTSWISEVAESLSTKLALTIDSKEVASLVLDELMKQQKKSKISIIPI